MERAVIKFSALLNLAMNSGDEPVAKSLPVWNLDRRFIASFSNAKFSSEDCGICHKMSFYDQKVAEELGLQFISVKMQDTATYRKYRKILLAQYPDKAEMGWPTYLICDAPETDDFKILGEVKGGHPKGEFRNWLQEVLA